MSSTRAPLRPIEVNKLCGPDRQDKREASKLRVLLDDKDKKLRYVEQQLAIAENKIDNLSKTQNRLHHKEREAKKALDHERTSQRRQIVEMRKIEGTLHKFVNREDEKLRRAQLGRKELEAEIEHMEEEHERAIVELEEKYKGTIQILEDTVTQCKEGFDLQLVAVSKSCEERTDSQADEYLKKLQILTASMNSLEQKAFILSSANAELSRELESSQNAMVKAQNVNETNLKKVSELEVRLLQKETKCQQLENEVSKKDAIAGNLQSQLDRAQQMYMEVCQSSQQKALDLGRQYSGANDSLRRAEDSLQYKKELIEKLEDDLAEQHRVNRDHNTAIKSMTAELETFRRTDTNQQNTITDIQNAYKFLSDELEIVNDRSTQQSLELKACKETNASLESQLNHLKILHEDTRKQLASSSELVDSCQQELMQTKWSLEMQQLRDDELTQALECKQAENMRLDKVVPSLKSQIRDLENKYTNVVTDISRLRDENSAKELSISSAQSLIVDLNMSMSEAEGRINELNGKYSKSLKESELLSEKLDVASKELTHERSSLLQERKSHTEIVNQLKSQIDEAKLEKERLFDRVTELEVERNESLEDLATASKEQNQMAEALARCKHELASSNKVIAETKEHTETLNEQKKTQSEELKRLEGELTAQVAIAGTLVEAKELAERTLHDITAQRDELFQRICSLTADLKKAHEENTNTSKTLSELNSANDRLRTQSSEMSCRLVTLQADLADSAASNLQLSALIANSDDEAGRLRAELDSIHVRKGSDSALLEKEMAALRDQLKCSKDANVQLRLKLSDVEAKYDELNGELRVNETHKSKLLCTLQESEGESQVLRTKLCAAKGEILCLQDRVSGLRTTPAKH